VIFASGSESRLSLWELIFSQALQVTRLYTIQMGVLGESSQEISALLKITHKNLHTSLVLRLRLNKQFSLKDAEVLLLKE
jgi:hypothetical protein